MATRCDVDNDVPISAMDSQVYNQARRSSASLVSFRSTVRPLPLAFSPSPWPAKPKCSSTLHFAVRDPWYAIAPRGAGFRGATQPLGPGHS